MDDLGEARDRVQWRVDRRVSRSRGLGDHGLGHAGSGSRDGLGAAAGRRDHPVGDAVVGRARPACCAADRRAGRADSGADDAGRRMGHGACGRLNRRDRVEVDADAPAATGRVAPTDGVSGAVAVGIEGLGRRAATGYWIGRQEPPQSNALEEGDRCRQTKLFGRVLDLGLACCGLAGATKPPWQAFDHSLEALLRRATLATWS